MNEVLFVSQVKLGKALLSGLIAGIIAAIAANLFYGIYRSAADVSFEELTLVSITMASLVPSLIASFVYWLFARYTAKPVLWFVSLSVVIAVASIFPNLDPPHEGFALPSTLLHLIVAVICMIAIPMLARRTGKT